MIIKIIFIGSGLLILFVIWKQIKIILEGYEQINRKDFEKEE